MDAIWQILTSTEHQQSLTETQVLTTLAVALICGCVIFLIYRFFNQSVVYSVRFNMLIVLVSLVTSLIIITIGTNLVMTLGMVGALSIVRFRAAVKDPLDVGFLFWGIAAGLTAGAQLHSIALIGTAFIAVVYIIFTILRLEKRSYLIIVRYDPEAEMQVAHQLRPMGARVKNKTSAADYSEITIEVKARKSVSFVDKLKRIDGVETVTLVEYTGDYS